MMFLIPAIDIKDQKCVRLFKGDFDKETVYSNSPLDVSNKWQSDGAKLIHIVDLDGALEGESKNFQLIRTILKNKKCEFQIGGGIRDLKTIGRYISIGARRVILGTSAFIDENLGFFASIQAFLKGNLARKIEIFETLAVPSV